MEPVGQAILLVVHTGLVAPSNGLTSLLAAALAPLRLQRRWDDGFDQRGWLGSDPIISNRGSGGYRQLGDPASRASGVETGIRCKAPLRARANFYSRGMEPPFYFVRDRASSAAHHWDYLRNRRATALCGHDYDDPQWEGTTRPSKVCRRCQEVLPLFEAKWWKNAARRIEVHRARLEESNARLQGEVTHLKRQLDQLTYQLELSKDTIETQKTKINNQRMTLNRLQTARSSKSPKPTKATAGSAKQPSKATKSKPGAIGAATWRAANDVFSSSGPKKGSKPSAPR